MDSGSVPQTWQEIFENQPIQTVRVVEKQLHAAALRDKERLRGLVGGNYRDLLSTAEEIISLDSRTRAAESLISELGSKCRPPQPSKLPRSTQQDATIAAQARLLSRCLLCAASALRDRTRLLSAEMIVISGLLLKSLSETEPASSFVETMRAQYLLQRRQVLKRIDAHLVLPKSATRSVIEAVCAYCLVTSASSSDAIKHFQTLRLDKLRQRLINGSSGPEHLRESFHYLMITIQALKSILSRGVNELLSHLQRQSILSSISPAKIEALGIDQARDLIPLDVLNFTPYIKRVLLPKNEIQLLVRDWTLDASRVFCDGLSKAVLDMSAVADVLLLRQHILEALLPVYFSTNGQDSLLQMIRDVVNFRVTELCQKQIKVILDVARDLVAGAPDTQVAVTMWDDAFVSRPGGLDASGFLHQVRVRHIGTRGSLERSLKRLRKWSKGLKQMGTELYSLRDIRWQDMIEEADEDEEDSATQVITKLSTEDTELYTASVETSLQEAIRDFDDILSTAVGKILAQSEQSLPQIVFYLRALRDSSSIVQNTLSVLPTQYKDLYKQLHEALAAHVVEEISSKFEKATLAKQMALIEDMPSPLAFSVLCEVCNVMARSGGIDIWSPAAVAVLKCRLRERVLESNNKASYTRNAFDEQYLIIAFATMSQPEELGSTKDITTKKASAYWNRTKLLFGHLS